MAYVDYVGHAPHNIAHGPPGGVGPRTKLYACVLLIIDGLGHATWSSTMPVSRSRTASF